MNAKAPIRIDWTRMPAWVRNEFDALDEVEQGLFLPSLSKLSDHRALMAPAWKSLNSGREKFGPKGPVHFVLEEVWRVQNALIEVERHRSTREKKIFADTMSGAIDMLTAQLARLRLGHLFGGYPSSIEIELSAAIQSCVRPQIRSELEWLEGDLEPDDIEDLQVNLEEAAARSLGDLEPMLLSLKSGIKLWAKESSPRHHGVLIYFVNVLTRKIGGKRQINLAATLATISTGRQVTLEAVKSALKLDKKRRNRAAAK